MDIETYRQFDIAVNAFLAISGFLLALSVFNLNRQRFRLDLIKERVAAKNEFKEILDIYFTLSGFPRDSALPKYPKPFEMALNLAGSFAMNSLIFSPKLVEISNLLHEFILSVDNIEQKYQNQQITFPIYNAYRDRQRESAKELQMAGFAEIAKHLDLNEPKSLGEQILSNLNNLPFLVSTTIGAIFALEITGLIDLAEIIGSLISKITG